MSIRASDPGTTAADSARRLAGCSGARVRPMGRYGVRIARPAIAEPTGSIGASRIEGRSSRHPTCAAPYAFVRHPDQTIIPSTAARPASCRRVTGKQQCPATRCMSRRAATPSSKCRSGVGKCAHRRGPGTSLWVFAVQHFSVKPTVLPQVPLIPTGPYPTLVIHDEGNMAARDSKRMRDRQNCAGTMTALAARARIANETGPSL